MRRHLALTCLSLVALSLGGCSRHTSSVTEASNSFGGGPSAPETSARSGPLASAAPAGMTAPPEETPHPMAAAPPASTALAAPSEPMGASGDGWRGSLAGAGGGAGAPRAKAASGLGAPSGFGLKAPRRESAAPFIPDSPVRAGEWDDNANYRDFLRYLADEETVPYRRVDLRNRRFVVVRDADGKAVPRCRVMVGDADQHTVTLTTTASGRAILFPHAEGFNAGGLTATASCGGGASARFDIEAEDDVVSLKLATRRALPARTVDIAFILDTTGSMSEEIEAVKSTISKVASSLKGESYRARLGLVEYKDRGDTFVTRVHPFLASPDAFRASVAGITASGGGDYPESVNQGLHDGLTELDWGDEAVAKMAFLIGDAPPHLEYANDSDYAVDMRTASHRGIQVFTVAASGMNDLGQAVWRQIAQYTGATNLFVLRGGAGPQSTGAGDPKSSCGGTQTQYASGNLDVLITRKILNELKGIDADPLRIAGLGQDESAKPCNLRVAMQ